MFQWKYISCFFLILFSHQSSGSPYWEQHLSPLLQYQNHPVPETNNEVWRIIPGFVKKPHQQQDTSTEVAPVVCRRDDEDYENNNQPISRSGNPSTKIETPEPDIVKVAAKVEYHSAWEILDKFECGESAADRIIGGINAALGQFPWMARLGFLNYDDLDYKCGGALLTDRHVVTAAHCVKSDFELTTVRLGEHDTRTDPDCVLNVCAPPVQDRKVKRIKSHDSFNTPPLHNDIAMIELEKPVELNNYVSPICLPRGNMLGEVQIGDMVTTAGWGTMNMTTEERANILQVVTIPIVNPEKCDLFGKSFRLRSSELCAGAQLNKDACGGDSGGPLSKVYDTPEGPKSYLIGVVSFGPTICGIKKPGVYTSVSHFLDWILDEIVK